MKVGKSAWMMQAEGWITAKSLGKRLFFKTFEVFPEGLVLFDEGFLGEGEFEAEDEVGEGVLMEDVMGEKGVAGDFEVEAEFAGAEAVVGFAGTDEVAHVFGAAGEQLGVDFADFLHQAELDRLGQLFQFGDGLVAERELIHGGKGARGGARG
jgi:hypothetical protein